MKVISVNAGKPVRLGRSRSGIYKTPITGPVEITPLGIEADAICDRRHHGGLDQALYIYRIEDYRGWAEELAMAVDAGWFGDNLTLEDIPDGEPAIGDVFRINDVVLQVTAPRKFQLVERPGFYCRVLATGMLRSEASVVFKAFDDTRVSVLEVFRNRYAANLTTHTIDRLLRSPIATMERQRLESLRPSAR